MESSVLIEVLVDSVASARAAQAGGANRLELCQGLFEGGTTPSAGMLKAVRAAVDLPISVMIRPRGGDFCYSDDEIDVMRHDILMAKDLGAQGVVFGMLNPNGTVDASRTSQLTELARPLTVTFHRAIDMSRDLDEALESLVRIGVDRVLTSGGEPTGWEGADAIAAMVAKAAGRIVVMPGGGIREQTVRKIVARTGAREIHVSASRMLDSRMEHRNTRVFMGRDLRSPEFLVSEVDPGRVAQYRALVDGK